MLTNDIVSFELGPGQDQRLISLLHKFGEWKLSDTSAQSIQIQTWQAHRKGAPSVHMILAYIFAPHQENNILRLQLYESGSELAK